MRILFGKISFLLPFLFLVFSGKNVSAQLYEVSLDARIGHSEFIFEGWVSNTHAYWDALQKQIYTSCQVQVTEDLLGNLGVETVQVILEGGQIGESAQVVIPNLKLSVGDRGIFLASLSHRPGSNSWEGPLLQAYAGPQGFVRYFANGTASDPFITYSDLQSQVKDRVADLRNSEPILYQSFPSVATVGAGVADVADFFPDTVTAGTKTKLTIVGSGFGPTKGQVWFKDADDGGLSWMSGDSADIKRWTGDTIQVWVPSVSGSQDQGSAGTGPIMIVTANGDTSFSQQSLEVTYGIRNRRIPGSGESNMYLLVDTNSAGGYTFRYSPEFRNDPDRVAVFEWAVREWRCATGVNFAIGADTLLADPQTDDRVSYVHLSALDTGTLGKTVILPKSCISLPGLDLFNYPPDIDIYFDNSTNWRYDSVGNVGNNRFDFASVALHELGHASHLRHVIAPGELMHFAISPGMASRTIGGRDLAAGSYVVDSSTVSRNGCVNPMVAINPNNCTNVALPQERAQWLPVEVSLYPNPASLPVNLTILASQNLGKCSLKIFDLSGRPVGIDQTVWIVQGTNHLHLSRLPSNSGMYFVVLESNKGSFTQKLSLVP